MPKVNNILVTDNFNDNDYFIAIMGAKDYDILQVVSDYVSSAFKLRSVITGT
jgi:hypothetical protein